MGGKQNSCVSESLGAEFASNFAEAELVEKQVVISASLSSEPEAPLYKPNALVEKDFRF
jgi:hypothetical protein